MEQYRLDRLVMNTHVAAEQGSAATSRTGYCGLSEFRSFRAAGGRKSVSWYVLS